MDDSMCSLLRSCQTFLHSSLHQFTSLPARYKGCNSFSFPVPNCLSFIICCPPLPHPKNVSPQKTTQVALALLPVELHSSLGSGKAGKPHARLACFPPSLADTLCPLNSNSLFSPPSAPGNLYSTCCLYGSDYYRV